ncbi:MAG: transcriptional regulator, partial [Lachnospiraceae bacterium]|nr:transcriptional regulator [Lachnospiraceae bacterium]
TEEIRQRNMGKVVRIFDVPSADLYTQVKEQVRQYVVEIAYPAGNLSHDFPMLLTALLGNDASTSAQVKLLDIEFPEGFRRNFPGPKYGVEGIRRQMKVEQRPLLLNMIKPCTGLSPKEGAKIFYEVAKGGVDFIKDDELLGNVENSHPWDRVQAYQEAARAAFEETGKEVIYIVNVTDGARTIEDTIKRALDRGAQMMMMNISVLGYSLFCKIAEEVPVPVLAHNAGAGIFYEGLSSGMSSPLAAGKLIRLAGADMVMINTPYGGYPLGRQKYLEILQKLLLPYGTIRPSFPIIGGGVHPGMVKRYMEEAGQDMILAAGGSILGHPMGAAAGGRAMMAAISAVMEGKTLEDAAEESGELKKALELWGD